MPVQTTFTKQKRELAKANALINEIRAQEVRVQRFDPEGKLQTEERTAFVDNAPEIIAAKVFDILQTVVDQHGARQQANSVNKGRFSFRGIQADFTVPQLRTLQDSLETLTALVNKLPIQNRKKIPNGEIDGHPAFLSPIEDHKSDKIRYLPYEEADTTRVRTYEERYEIVDYQTRTVEIDYGLTYQQKAALTDLVSDFGTAIQIAIDEANGLPQKDDKELNRVMHDILDLFRKEL